MKCRTEQLAATKERIEKQKFPTITQTHYPLETKGELLRKPTIPDIPAVKQAEITCTDRELGPRVPTILVIVGKKLQKTRGQQTTNFKGPQIQEKNAIFSRYPKPSLLTSRSNLMFPKLVSLSKLVVKLVEIDLNVLMSVFLR